MANGLEMQSGLNGVGRSWRVRDGLGGRISELKIQPRSFGSGLRKLTFYFFII